MTKKPRSRASHASPSIPAPPERRRFRQRLLTWYGRHGRDLPWRRTDDPYHILVSEIMLQQTQVDRVLPKYHEWLEKFPSFHALASADEAHVNETWRPLGYNIRPKRLQAIAREAVARYDGRLPDDEATLLSFKGIGQSHRRCDPQLRVPAARRDPRHQRRTRALPRLRRRGRSQEPRDEETSVGGVRGDGAAQAGVRLQPGADGLRRDRVRRAQPEVPGVPDGQGLPIERQGRVRQAGRVGQAGQVGLDS
ncbi:MAG: hypothetical protein QM736_24560 [Vicinamibacterales bacterium]